MKELTQSRFSILQQTMSEKINEWSAEVERLNRQIQEAKSLLDDLRPETKRSKSTAYSTEDSTLETIISIFKETKEPWLAPQFIRSQFSVKTGRDINRATLRNYLKNANGVRFDSKGKTRFTVYRLVENDEK